MRFVNEEQQQRLTLLGHVLMLLILILLIALYIKNYLITRSATFEDFSYLVAFGVPASLILVVAADILYERFIAKLQRSHAGIYNRLLASLVVVTLSAITAVLLTSLYMSKPQSLAGLGALALIPYFLSWLIVAAFYVYISPGLLDPQNRIPKYQVVMAAIYILFAAIYPVLYIMVASARQQEAKNKG